MTEGEFYTTRNALLAKHSEAINALIRTHEDAYAWIVCEKRARKRLAKAVEAVHRAGDRISLSRSAVEQAMGDLIEHEARRVEITPSGQTSPTALRATASLQASQSGGGSSSSSASASTPGPNSSSASGSG